MKNNFGGDPSGTELAHSRDGILTLFRNKICRVGSNPRDPENTRSLPSLFTVSGAGPAGAHVILVN